MRILRVVLAVMCVSGFVGLIIGLWWWALLGMSPNVGFAGLMTCIAFFFAGGMGATYPGWDWDE